MALTRQPARPGRRHAMHGALVIAAVLAPAAVRAAPASQAGAMASATASESGSESGEATPIDKPERTREWITHSVVPREKLDDIAARYGVTRAEILKWNKKKLHPKGYIYSGQKLKIYAKLVPPPRAKITYVVQSGDTWAKIATKHNVQATDLRYWNKKVPKQFRAGTKLVVYTNPIAKPASESGELVDDALPEINVRAGGVAIGHPNRGRLINGVQLKDTDMLKVRDADKAYGTTHALQQLQKAVAAFRKDTGYEPKLVVGAISLKNGGRFRPHSSHQTGRDVDLRLPKRKGADEKSSSADDIDWALSWELVEALIDTGEVEYIFLDYVRQKRLHRAAKDAGATSKQIERAIQYPNGKSTNHGVVRHADGHNVHIHIRFKCAPENTRCESL